MNPEKDAYQPESKESQNFEISITVHRHGPKEGIAGPLSGESEKQIEEYFIDAYQGIVFDDKEGGIKIEHSPIERAQKTAEIYANVIEKYGIGKTKSRQADERLSEGNIAEHIDLIEKYGGTGSRWINSWMELNERPLPEIKTGKEAAADFSEWIVSRISDSKKRDKAQEINAFSHGPAMAAFILKLEEKIGEKILTGDLQKGNVFKNALGYLSYINIHTDSTNPNNINFHFAGKNFELPISTLHELVKENQFMADALKDISDDTISNWLSAENLSSKNKQTFQGFEIIESVDGNINSEREVSLIKITEAEKYTQFTQSDSDTTAVVTSGEAIAIIGDEQREIKTGDSIKIPRGMPCILELKQGNTLELLSIQSPATKNPEKQKNDSRLADSP